MKRRDAIKRSALLGGTAFSITTLPTILTACGSNKAANDESADSVNVAAEDLFKISLAQWSLHNSMHRWQSGQDIGDKIDPLEFARIARKDYGIEAVEYVNTFYWDKINDKSYLEEIKNRADDNGVKSLLIMVDAEGALGDPDDANRTQAAENHRRWIEAAQFLGCHSIRVNARSDNSLSYDEQMNLAADGLHQVCEISDDYGIHVIVENHGGLSSNGDWLVAVMEKTDHPRVGTLPDFGNFCIKRKPRSWECEEEYDRYKGVDQLMPWARAVSAKTHQFNEEGNEVNTDYFKMMEIVLKHDYHGYVGVEYEGRELSEPEGIKATRDLLIKVRKKLAS